MRRVVLGPSLRTARIRRMPTARRPWLVTVRSDGTVSPSWPRTYHTFEEARTVTPPTWWALSPTTTGAAS